jgi:hypothetical protein
MPEPAATREADSDEQVGPETQARGRKGIAKVTVDHLRVRSAPDLEAAVVGRLHAGQRVEVTTASDEMQAIGEYEDYWYQIDSSEGEFWVYGAFLSFDPPGELPEQIRVSNARVIDHTRYENESFPVTGFEFPLDLPWEDDFEIAVEYAYNHLHFIWPTGAELNSLTVYDPEGRDYALVDPQSGLYRISPDSRIIDIDFDEVPTDLHHIRFLSVARFPPGTWTLKLGGETDITYEFSRRPATWMGTSDTYFSPLYPPFRPDDSQRRIHLYSQHESDQTVRMVLYRDESDDPGTLNVVPVFAFSFDYAAGTTWRSVLEIGTNEPGGDYRLGYTTTSGNETAINWFESFNVD